jgi:hypothetical protein
MLIPHGVHDEAFYGNKGVSVSGNPILGGSRSDAPGIESILRIKKPIAI